jgi:hypothetical protein
VCQYRKRRLQYLAGNHTVLDMRDESSLSSGP